MKKNYLLYASGSCNSTSHQYGQAGWSYILMDNEGTIIDQRKEYVDWSTENKMVLRAIYEGCKAIKDWSADVTVYCNSDYAAGVMSGKYIAQANLDIINPHKRENGERLHITYKVVKSTNKTLKPVRKVIDAAKHVTSKTATHRKSADVYTIQVDVTRNVAENTYTGHYTVFKNHKLAYDNKFISFKPSASQVICECVYEASMLVPIGSTMQVILSHKIANEPEHYVGDKYTENSLMTVYGYKYDISVKCV